MFVAIGSNLSAIFRSLKSFHRMLSCSSAPIIPDGSPLPVQYERGTKTREGKRTFSCEIDSVNNGHERTIPCKCLRRLFVLDRAHRSRRWQFDGAAWSSRANRQDDKTMWHAIEYRLHALKNIRGRSHARTINRQTRTCPSPEGSHSRPALTSGITPPPYTISGEEILSVRNRLLTTRSSYQRRL